MRKVLRKAVLFINPIAEIVEFAIYIEGVLDKQWRRRGYVSDILIDELHSSIVRHGIEAVIYVNGPGSFMSVKLTYVALETLRIVKAIPFFGCSAFCLNGGRPLKAMGNLYFIKEKETIITQKLNEKIEQVFRFPSVLDDIELKESNQPEYIIPAV